jgi:hypothetical protein
VKVSLKKFTATKNKDRPGSLENTALFEVRETPDPPGSLYFTAKNDQMMRLLLQKARSATANYTRKLDGEAHTYKVTTVNGINFI